MKKQNQWTKLNLNWPHSHRLLKNLEVLAVETKRDRVERQGNKDFEELERELDQNEMALEEVDIDTKNMPPVLVFSDLRKSGERQWDQMWNVGSEPHERLYISVFQVEIRF